MVRASIFYQNCGEFGGALTAAAYFGNKACVEFLISNSASVDLAVNTARLSNATKAAEAELSKEEIRNWWSNFNLIVYDKGRVEVSKRLRSLMNT